MEFKTLKKAVIWLAIHITGFVVAVWFFLGFNPQQTYTQTIYQLTQYKNVVARQFHLFFDASARLGDKAHKYGLQEAEDVRAGKDYYSDYNKQVDQELRNQINR